MNEEQQAAQTPSQPQRKSLEELIQEAEQQAQKIETPQPTGEGFSFAKLDAVVPTPEVPKKEDVPAPTEPIVTEPPVAQVAESEAIVTEPLKVAVAAAPVEVVVGPSLEDIEKELKQSQAWEEEHKRREREEHIRKVPVLPIVLSILFVIFTTLFFSNPGSGFVQPLQISFLASITEGNPRVFEGSNEKIVERSQLQVGDVVQTYEHETTVEFFDKSRVVLMPSTQIEIRGLSRQENLVQLALLEGSLWVDDRDIHSKMEIFPHTQAGAKDIKGFYRSLLGTYYLSRGDGNVGSYAVTSPLYLVLEKNDKETTTLIPPYSAAKVYDSQLKQNVYDLDYSKAKTEFKLHSYLKPYQTFLTCGEGEQCASEEPYDIIKRYVSYSLGYTIQLRTDGEFLVRGLALGQGSLQILLQERFPFLVLSEKKMEREAFMARLSTIATVFEKVLDAPDKPSVLTEFKETLKAEISTLEEFTRIRPLFLVADIALPTEPLYEAKLALEVFEQSLLTPKERLVAAQQRFIERNNEFYRLLLQNQTDFILEHLPTYLDEVKQFVEKQPAYIGLIEEARVLTENMLIAVPKLYETDIFEGRFALESLELSLVADNLRDPLRLEFARMKIDVMQQLLMEISTTSNAYLRQLYIDRMEQLITQFEELKIENITFAEGPVRVLQSEFLALRRDYLSLRGVAPSEEVERLRRETEAALDALTNHGVGRVQPEEELTPEQERQLLRQNAVAALEEIGLSMRIVKQDEELPRIFTVTGVVLGTPFTGTFNVTTGAFSQLSIGDQQLATVVDKRYLALFLENTIAPPEDDTSSEITGEQRNYYREQLQVARRKRVYDALVRYGVTVARISDIRPVSAASTENFYISKATVDMKLQVAEGREGLVEEQTFTLTFSGIYNISDDTVSQITLMLPTGGSMQLSETQLVNRLALFIQAQFHDIYLKDTYITLMKKLMDDEGIHIQDGAYQVSGKDFTLFSFSSTPAEVSGETKPIMFAGNLDVMSGNIYDARWSYDGREFTILTLPVQELKEHIQSTVRSIKQEQEEQQRREQERLRAEEEERLRLLKEEQQKKFEEEALQFTGDTTPRS